MIWSNKTYWVREEKSPDNPVPGLNDWKYGTIIKTTCPSVYNIGDKICFPIFINGEQFWFLDRKEKLKRILNENNI